MKRCVSLLLFLLALFFYCGQPARAQTSNASEVKKKLKVLAVQTVKTRCQNCKVHVECKWISPKINGILVGRITGLYFEEPGMPKGYVHASVDLKGATATVEAAVQMYITVQKKVPVASTRIERGARIDRKKLVWQWKDITRLNRRPISSSELFKNKTAARLIREGDMIFATDLIGKHSIQPGDRVEMLYNENGIRIKIDCIARDAKSKGDKIKLYSKETRQRYIAKIVNENKIIWVKTL